MGDTGNAIRMSGAKIVAWIRKKYNALVEDLDERGRRRWAASEAEAIGYGGITVSFRQAKLEGQAFL